jgi:hypothetical protein
MVILFHAQEEYYERLWELREQGLINKEQFISSLQKDFFVGRIIGFEHPQGMPLQEYWRWWPSLNESEQRHWRESHQCLETHNLLTVQGRTQLLSYIGSNAAVNAPFAQYLAIGNFPIANVSGGDTSVQGEIYRQIPNSAVVTGTQIDIQTVIGTSSGNGTWTNCGLYGLNATSTSGSGTLMTHALLSYTKLNTQGVTVDYLVNLQ